MRYLATLLLSAALGLTAWAGGEGSWSKATSANSCRHQCPVANEATTLGRQIAMEMPVASVERGELET